VDKWFVQLHNLDTTSYCTLQIRDEPLKLSLVLEAGSPMILLPVSSKSPDLLVVDLGQLVVTNSFKLSGDPDTISVVISDGNFFITCRRIHKLEKCCCSKEMFARRNDDRVGQHGFVRGCQRKRNQFFQNGGVQTGIWTSD
jgi:hypothetical protein